MRLLLSLAAIGLLSSPAFADEGETVEAKFVACLADKQPELIAQIRDAESQEGFEAAMKSSLEICPTETEKMSMGKLFRELAKHGSASEGEGS
jgi:hypothetical protein